MVLRGGYSGRRIAYRAYYGEKLIWDIGQYINVSDWLTSFNGDVFYQTCSTVDINLYANEIVDLISAPYALNDDRNMDVDIPLNLGPTPRAIDTANAFGSIPIICFISVSGGTYTVVFTCGDIYCDLLNSAHPNAANSVKSAGDLSAVLFLSCSPEHSDMLNLKFESILKHLSSCVAEDQNIDKLLFNWSTKLTSSSNPGTLPVFSVKFKNDDEALHESRVIDGYPCEDPIGTNQIEIPKRKTTAQYTYEFSGWSDGTTDNIYSRILLPEQKLFFNDIGSGLYEFFTFGQMPSFTVGDAYNIIWDNRAYTCTAFKIELNGISGIACGNASIVGAGADTNEPFIIGTSVDGSIIACYTLKPGESHKVSIYEGNADCILIDSITQDTDFYACFIATLRNYIARFYLEDELKKEQTVPYGETATPPEITKEGYIVEWAPSDMTITGDTNFYGVWTRDYILSEITIDFTYSSNEGSYTATTTTKKGLKNGSAYVVEWDGELYRCVLRDIPGKIYSGNNSADVTMLRCLGNGDQRPKVWGVTFVPDDTGVYNEPFLIVYYEGDLMIYTQSKDPTHTISVYAV